MEINYRTLRASKARNPNNDTMFSNKVVEYRTTKKCSLAGCDNHLTFFKGPGSRLYCREHQLLLREYGGHARCDREYTFWKKDYCEECGHRPMRDNKVIAAIAEPFRTILGKMMLHVDHIVTAGKEKYKSSNHVNHPDNLKTLCQECHMLKTYTSGDHWAEWHDR